MLQTRLLEDLDEDVEVTDTRFKAATARMKQILHKSSTCKQGSIMFALIVALVLLTILGFKLHHMFSA